MPGYAWGISAKHCITGAKLRATVPSSPCAKCYALKGRYLFPNVREAMDRRLEAWKTEPDWVFKMAGLIGRRTKNEAPYFRWFDSGDLQSPDMLRDIFAVCELRPDILFWLPTQERGMVDEVLKDMAEPDNLIIRISLTRINGPRPNYAQNTACLLPRIYKSHWPDRVVRSTHARHYCPSPVQEGKCGDCRACWNKEITNVVYLQH